MRNKKIVAYIKQDWNVFILDFIKPEKAMAMSCRRPRYVVSKTK